jgi:hypothetical protein
MLGALLTGLLIWWLAGHRVTLVTDEGIYLDGARRIVAGQAPFRDFFVLTGPGHFWNLAMIFHFLGMTLAHARLMLVFDLAVLAGGMFWLAARLSSRVTAAVLTFVFVGLLSVNGALLAVGHRWDSSAAAFTGIVLLWAGLERGRRVFFVAAGVAAGYAAWITPSVLLVPIAIAVWLLAHPKERWKTVPFLTGVALVSAVAVFTLVRQQALIPMIEHLLWTSSNYVQANRVPYGSMTGGYSLLLWDATGLDWLARVVILFFHSLPPLLPLVALGWLFRLRRETRPISLLLVCGAALVLSAYPRWEIEHLLFIAPLFYVLAGCWLADALPQRVLPAVGILFTLAAFTFMLAAVTGRLGLASAETKRGLIQGTPADLAVIKNMLEPLPAKSPVFAYIYLPTLYFFTDAINPTRYSFLQPGMMTEDDERSVIADLKRRPPLQVIHGRMTDEEMLRIWPKSNPRRLHFTLVDEWLAKRYAPSSAGRATIEIWLPNEIRR